MERLSWEQIHAWRLARHGLAGGPSPDLIELVRAICGLHAQLASSAELALWARGLPGAGAALEAALWERRALVKTWAMRGTLHLLPADDLPLYCAARGATPARRPPSYYTYHGVTPEEFAAIGEGVRAVLGAEGLSREELAGAVAERTGYAGLREVLRSGWGALLKPSAHAGELCFGPSRGQQVTFVAPRAWLGAWQEHEPQAAFAEVARRFLLAYGPATPEEFARWWGCEPAPAKRLFKAMGDELAAVEVEGWRGFALRASLAGLGAAAPVAEARLLPSFDPYTVALLRQEAVLPEARRGLVSRPQGWIAPVVLHGGRIVGTWEHETKGRTTRVAVTTFEPASAGLRAQIEAEAQRLGPQLGTAIELAPIASI